MADMVESEIKKITQDTNSKLGNFRSELKNEIDEMQTLLHLQHNQHTAFQNGLKDEVDFSHDE